MGAEDLASTRIRSPDRPACRELVLDGINMADNRGAGGVL